MADAVDRYFEALHAHDWPAMRACLADDFIRRGPYADNWYPDPDLYVAYLAEVLPTYVNHSIEVTRRRATDGVVTAEWTERMGPDEARNAVRVCLVMELDADGKIARIEAFLRKLTPQEA